MLLALLLGFVACSAESDSKGDRDGAGGSGSGAAPSAGTGGSPTAGDASIAGSGAGANGGAGQSGETGMGGNAGAATAGAGGGAAGGTAEGGGGGAGVLTCRDGEYEDKVYRVCPHAGVDRAMARAFCQQSGLDLLSLDSAGEDSWAYDFVTESGSIWIGANDIDQEGDWRWPNGSAVSAGFTAWAAGQPNDSGDGEDCAVLHSGMGEWNDVACEATTFGSDPLSVICEP